MRFGRSSDEIEQWSLAKKASLPARTIWSRETSRDLKAVLREHRPDVVHVHNTFPLLSAAVLYACRDAGVPVVATIHNYRLACANGTFFRSGAVCHDCAHGLPVRSVLHGCYRESRAATAPVALAMGLHRQAWRSLVSAYVFISASQRDLLGGFDPAPGRVFVRYNLIPERPPSRNDQVQSRLTGLPAVAVPASHQQAHSLSLVQPSRIDHGRRPRHPWPATAGDEVVPDEYAARREVGSP